MAIAKSSQLVRPGLIQSTMQLNAWAADKFSNAHIAFCRLLYTVLSLSSLQITLALCLLLHNRIYLLYHKTVLLAWVADYFLSHHMLFLSTVS